MPDLAVARAGQLADLTPIGDELFRAVFGSVPTPVSVVTTTVDGCPRGATVSSFCSLSLDPPLVLVSLNRKSRLLRAIRRTRSFCVNVLAAGQEDLALRFAGKDGDRFEGLPWFDRHGLPVLPSCQSWLVASVDRVIATGDHMSVSGLIFDAHVDEGTPLLYHARRFDELASERRGRPRSSGASARVMGTRDVEVGVRELGDGRPVLLADPVRGRADLVAVAERMMTPDVLEMLRNRGGRLAVAVSLTRAKELGLVGRDGLAGAEPHATVVARSARGKGTEHAIHSTLETLTASTTRAEDLTSPGHLAVLVARDGGLLECLGRAEAAVDAARLAGAAAVALVAELNAPGRRAFGPAEVAHVARELSISVVDLEQLAQARRELAWSLW